MEDLYLNNKAHCDNCSGRNPNKWHCNILGTNCMTVCHCPIKRFDNDADWFPVLLPYRNSEYGRTKYYVPFSMIKEHEKQCLENHRQTAARLKERGGLSWDEMWAVVHDIRWEESPYKNPDDARIAMMGFTETWKPLMEEGQEEEKYFIVPVEWTVCGFMRQKAVNARHAIQLVHDDENISVPLLSETEYVDGSFAVSGYDCIEDCVEMTEKYTKDYETGHPISVIE